VLALGTQQRCPLVLRLALRVARDAVLSHINIGTAVLPER
jgi:hypothetical protein